MLSEIRIEALGAINAATAEFDRGLTVLTGETGTGKTMVVTGLHLLGGARADDNRVRSGSDRAVVEGRFSTDDLTPDVAARIDGLTEVPETRFARGSYYAVPGRAAFRRLIYPVPEPGGLGVHLTLDLGGAMRFGPDVEWIDTVDYRVNPTRRAHFEAEIRRYWPGLPAGALAPTYCGIRPKLSGEGEPAADFRIDGPAAHGIAGLVNLYGIESPGLTASLAIGDHVAGLLD